MKDLQILLYIEENAESVYQQHGKILFFQIKDWESWVNFPSLSIGPIPKAKGGVRPCVDVRATNEDMFRQRHVILTLHEVIHKLNGAKIFTELDLNQGYHQLYLYPDSRRLTLFIHTSSLRSVTGDNEGFLTSMFNVDVSDRGL